MFKFLTRTNVLWWLLPLALLATAKASADAMIFSYTFAGTNPGQVYAPGSVLIGHIDGTIDPMDPNRVTINSFGPVSLLRPGFPPFNYPPIANNEFNTFPSGNTPVMTFDGSEIDFRACPSGFTNISPDTLALDDCPFALEGGFLVETVVPFDPMGFATAADGSGAAGTALCGVSGCRVTDRPLVGVWSLAVLPDLGTEIYGAAHQGPEGESTLYRINPFTGAATAVGTGIGFQRVSGMDFDPTTGILYATGEREAGDLDVNVLLIINPSTGVGTEIGPTGVVDFAGVFSGTPSFEGVFSDLSFRPSDHTLFGFSFPGQWVATIDLATGDATQLAFETVIGDRGIEANSGNALAFLDSVLVHAGSVGPFGNQAPSCAPNCVSALHDIDVGTNLVTTSVALDFPFVAGFDNDFDIPRANGMDFHSVSETLFASIIYGFSGGGATFLGTIDTLGNVDLIGETKLGMDTLTVITSVDVDIKPGSNPNSINPRKKGVIAVAILGSSDFDVTQVDVTTVLFGPDGATPTHNGHVEDVNTDGFIDFVVHFKAPDSGIACGDTDATLTGSTGENPFIGMDSVNTVGCPTPAVAKYVNDFSSSVGSASLFGDAVLDSGSVRLTDSINSQLGSLVIDEFVPGSTVASFTATFDFQTGPGSFPPADGISFNLGQLPNFAFGEEGTSGGLTISFDTFDNGFPDHIGIDVLVNGTVVASDGTNPFTNGVFVPVSVVFDADGTLDLTFDGAAIFIDLPTGITLATGDRFGFGGRTGGSNEVNRIDNVSIFVVPQ